MVRLCLGPCNGGVGGCSFEPVDIVEVSKRERHSAMCIEVGREEGGESLKAEPWQLRGKHVWGMFVLHLPPERSCVHCPFSQNTGTQQTPSRFALRPTPQLEHRGPHVCICKKTLSVLRYALYSKDYAYALDLGRRVKLDVIWRTLGWSALLTGYSLHPASLTCPEGQWMCFSLEN